MRGMSLGGRMHGDALRQGSGARRVDASRVASPHADFGLSGMRVNTAMWRKPPSVSRLASRALPFLLVLSACSAPAGPVTQSRQLPFALTTVTLYDHAREATFTACFERIETILNEFNMYNADSEISAVNQAAGKGPVRISADFCDALGQALQLANLTDGLFDPTVGPLVRLWKIGSDQAHVPKPEEINSALHLIGWKDVAFNQRAKTVSLSRPGMTLDFGAILKGFAAVETGRVLNAKGVKSAVCDIGGSVLALGSRPDGTPWRIGIQTPGAPTGVHLGVVEVRDEVVNTSGSYEQFFVQNGRHYQHIFDPHTGYPIDNGIISVTVVAKRVQNADGPTLAILASGTEKALALAQRLGVDAIVVGEDHTIHITPGLSGRFVLDDASYRIVAH